MSHDIDEKDKPCIDYRDSFPHAMLAQGRGKHVFILERLATPFQRADGRRVSYQLDYRWLSEECQRPDDEAWCCVQGSEMTYWSANELRKLGLKIGTKTPVPQGFVFHNHVLY